MAVSVDNWSRVNQEFLIAALQRVRRDVERHAARGGGDPLLSLGGAAIALEEEMGDDSGLGDQALAEIAAGALAPPALQSLCAIFALSPFERDLLVLCAGMELASDFAPLCAAAHGDTRRAYPTFSLALAALPAAHWSAVTPSGPLRHWRLIDLGAGDSLTLRPLRLDERILHYLTGVQHPDGRLEGLVYPVAWPDGLVPSHLALAERIAAAWTPAPGGCPLPVVQLCGDEAASKRTVAAAACATLGLELCALSAHALPLTPSELEALMRLWSREAALSPAALLLDADDAEASDVACESAINRVLEGAVSALFVTGRHRRRTGRRALLTFEVAKPTAAEQAALWRDALGGAAASLDGHLAQLVAHFSLNVPKLHAACAEAVADSATTADASDDGVAVTPQALWDACRRQVRPHLEDLAQRLDAAATWDDLVLPAPALQALREMATHTRHRQRVYETWGFAQKCARGLGVSALFAGASGTGKTLAAEVLANELRLDLWRIDLSQVVSKYIGETEKNLCRVFDAAEEGGAILLFDEADALFGKRSEVKDSHDRYANVEVSYLLQRMEAYRGLAILTTNMKEALDQAFLRRLRFVVHFPFPDAGQRAEIWRRVFPQATPTEGLDATLLARLNVTGGNIRNIALHAAFLAADADQPVRMCHVLQAARTEYGKLEKPLTDAEIGGWA